jgi:nucleoside-diphosphate-sugar epimerase
MGSADYLLTGGSGFLGAFVARRLVNQGAEVVGVARSDEAALKLIGLGCGVVRADLDDPAATTRAFAESGARALVNVASLGFGHAPTIVQAAQDAGIERAVFVSTTAIFTALNAPSKAVRTAAERTVMESDLQWTIIRPTMIYGTPDDRNLWRLLQFLRRSPVVPLPGGGSHLQQPVHVDDLAQAVVAGAQRDDAVGQAFDVAGPQALTFRQIVQEAAAALARRPLLVPAPVGAIIRGLRFTESRGVRLPLKAEQFERLTEDKAFDISQAREVLGFAPRSFADGIGQEAAMSART